MIIKHNDLIMSMPRAKKPASLSWLIFLRQRQTTMMWTPPCIPSLQLGRTLVLHEELGRACSF